MASPDELLGLKVLRKWVSDGDAGKKIRLCLREMIIGKKWTYLQKHKNAKFEFLFLHPTTHFTNTNSYAIFTS